MPFTKSQKHSKAFLHQLNVGQLDHVSLTDVCSVQATQGSTNKINVTGPSLSLFLRLIRRCFFSHLFIIKQSPNGVWDPANVSVIC
jgi:hypothetical protein